MNLYCSLSASKPDLKVLRNFAIKCSHSDSGICELLVKLVVGVSDKVVAHHVCMQLDSFHLVRAPNHSTLTMVL
jgi:hypothetical protein